MLETAIVIKIENDIATLSCGDSAGCQNCAAHGMCGGVSDRTFEAWNASKLNLSPGDRVEVLLPTGKAISSAFMVMIFPLLLFFVFFYAAKLLLGNPGEGIQVLGGLVGIAAGFGFNFLLNRRTVKNRLPVIQKKLD